MQEHNPDTEQKSLPIHIDESEFHYSREERLSSAKHKSPKKRRNRGLIILVIDVIIILGFVFVYNIFLRPDPSKVTNAGYLYELLAFEFDGEALVSLRITAEGDAEPGATSLISLEFSNSEDFADAVPLLEVLPNKKEQTITSDIRLPLSETVYLRVREANTDRGESSQSSDDWDFMLYAELQEP